MPETDRWETDFVFSTALRTGLWNLMRGRLQARSGIACASITKSPRRRATRIQ